MEESGKKMDEEIEEEPDKQKDTYSDLGNSEKEPEESDSTSSDSEILV